MPDPPYDIVALVSNDLVTDQRMQRCLTSLQAAGYRCLLLGRVRPGCKPLDESLPFAQERLELAHDAGKLFYVDLARAQHQRLVELQPRSILVVDLDTMVAGARAASRLGIPWIYDAHELFTEIPEVARRPHIKWAWGRVAKQYVNAATACYTVGFEIALALEQRYRLLSVGVIRNLPFRTADATRRAIAPPNEPFTVLYQGALNEGRGLEQLLRAAQLLPDVRFWIAGDGYLSDELQTTKRREEIPNVEFLGNLPPKQLRELTPRADLGYALMELRGLNYYFSLSNKSLDYVQAGVPSLQMDWPEYRRIEDAFGCYHLVKNLSVQSIVYAIETCRQPSYYAKLQDGCLRAAERLNWDVEQSKLLSIWRAVLPVSSAG